MDVKPEIYKHAGKAVELFANHGDDIDMTEHIGHITAAKNDILSIIHELTSPKKTARKAHLGECVRNALNDLHPTTGDYSRFEAIIADAADIAATLAVLEDGLAVKEGKMTEARMFCLHMRHELEAATGGSHS